MLHATPNCYKNVVRMLLLPLSIVVYLCVAAMTSLIQSIRQQQLGPPTLTPARTPNYGSTFRSTNRLAAYIYSIALLNVAATMIAQSALPNKYRFIFTVIVTFICVSI